VKIHFVAFKLDFSVAKLGNFCALIA